VRKYIIIIAALNLVGCANQTKVTPGDFQQATQVVERHVVIRPPDLKMSYQFSYDNNPALKRAFLQYQKTGKAPNVITEGFVQFSYGTGVQPVIAASPLELTVISLEPGEKVTNVSSGDPLRWSYSLAYSGDGSARQAHVMIKPSQPSISTDLVITTDKRLYTVKITTVNNGKYVRDVRFWYPEEMQSYWEKYNNEQTQKIVQHEETEVATVPDVSLNNLNFNYGLTKNTRRMPSWAPVRIFDDSVHTYIQFPYGVSSRDLPALFVLNGKTKELVNYRTKFPYFVVDKIFRQAVLVYGAGSDQSIMTITNNRF
jgi:type IV secretion system protein VirB9